MILADVRQTGIACFPAYFRLVDYRTGEIMTLEGLARRLYAERLRQQLIRRMPEHRTRVEALTDDELIQKDEQHRAMKLESIRVTQPDLLQKALNSAVRRFRK
jgi:hypothetical protein